MAWNIAFEPVDSRDSVAALRAYLVDIVSRYHGRPATAAEIDEELAESPVDRFALPQGRFLLARDGGGEDGPGSVVGCAGIWLLSPKVAELKRVWVHPDVRGRGLGAALLAAAEQAAIGLGATTMRLDTRGDLTEARRLYARHGYVEIAPYHHNPYADHFFEKRLD